MMNSDYKKALNAADMPREFSPHTRDTIGRIEDNPNVYGVLYLRKEDPQLCTLPETMAKTLTQKLPNIDSSIRRAIIEIDSTDEPIAYRIENQHVEIAVVTDKHFTACVVHKSKRKRKAIRHHEIKQV